MTEEMMGLIGKESDKAEFAVKWGELHVQWEGLTDRLSKAKVRALQQLKSTPRIADRTELPGWKYVILLRKLEHLSAATKIGEINEILMEAKSDNKRVYIPLHSRFWLLEEEALFWMEKSLEAPLSEDGHQRFMKVFQLLCEKYGLSDACKAVTGSRAG